MADRQRPQAVVQVGPHVEVGGPLRGAEPLVAVAGVVGGTQRVELEAQHAWSVGAVDEGLDAALAQGGHQRLDRHAQARLARDVVDQNQPCPVGDRLEHALQHDRGIRDRKRQLHQDDRRAGPLRRVVQRVRAGVVLVVRDDQLVPDFELDAAQDGVDPFRRVSNQRQVVRIRAEELAELGAHLVQSLLETPSVEADGLALDQVGPRTLALEHRDRTGPEAAVVEERLLWVDPPVASVGRRGDRGRLVDRHGLHPSAEPNAIRAPAAALGSDCGSNRPRLP